MQILLACPSPKQILKPTLWAVKLCKNDGEMSTRMEKSKPKQYMTWPSSSEAVIVYGLPVFYFLIASWKMMWRRKTETETRK